MNEQFLIEFRTVILRSEEKLLALSEEQSRTPRAPGKWSPKEIVGHLIDSASNNHQRFIRAQFKDDLIFDGYAQDDWVRVQNYNSEDWKQLVTLFRSFNLHILHAVSSISEEILSAQRKEHNLHAVAMGEFRQDEPATLEGFIRDYLEHMKHHLHQIIPGA